MTAIRKRCAADQVPKAMELLATVESDLLRIMLETARPAEGLADSSHP